MCIELYCRLIGESISNMPGNRKKIVATGRLRSLLMVLALAIFVFPSGLVYALQEIKPHSIFKHHLIETIAYHENVDTVFDLYGGAIVYEKPLLSGQTISEIGAAGRIIMNGFVKQYYINDMNYQRRVKCDLHSTVDSKLVEVFVSKVEVNNILTELESFDRTHGQYLAIIDPYSIGGQEVNDLQKAVKRDQNKKLLIFSKFDISRFTNNYPHCNSVVYSDPPHDKEHNEYTLIGCNINSWKISIATTLDAMDIYALRDSVDGNSNEIYLGQFLPSVFDPEYMNTAQSVQSCVGFIPPAQ